MKRNTALLIGSGAALMIISSAAGAYYTLNAETAKETATVAAPAPVAQYQAQAPQQHPAPPPCNDGNIVGMATGAVAGGLIGNQIGKGKGKTVATLGGAGAGAYLGQQHIPTHGVTCR